MLGLGQTSSTQELLCAPQSIVCSDGGFDRRDHWALCLDTGRRQEIGQRRQHCVYEK